MFRRCITILLVLICCFLCACQPTPEKQIIVNKSETNLEQSLETPMISDAPIDLAETSDIEATSTSKPVEPIETINDSFRVGNNEITVDADVFKFKEVKKGCYSIKYASVGQEKIDRYVKCFFNGLDVFTNASRVLIKSDYLDMIVQIKLELADWERYDQLSEEEKKTLNPTGTSPDDKITELKDKLSQLEEEYGRAPEKAIIERSDAVIKNGQLDIIIPRDNGTISTFTVNDRCIQYFDYLHKKQVYFQKIGEDYLEMNISLEEAIDKASKILRDLGFENWTYLRNRIYLENAAIPYYSLSFSPSIDGIVLSNDLSVLNNIQTDDEVNDTASYAPPINYPNITIEVSNNGAIIGFVYNFAFDSFEPVTTDINIIDFNEIYDIFKTNMLYKHLSIGEQIVNIEISKISLSYCLTRRKDYPEDYLVVPVWNFSGPYYEVVGKDRKSVDDQEYVYMRINAIDGSMFDIDLGV